jgi:hypothetical protein
MLHANMASAYTKVSAQVNISSREVNRRIEEAHDWLKCLADNAITAAECEFVLKELYSNLDKEKERGLVSLQSGIKTYNQQHSNIMDAITVFSGILYIVYVFKIYMYLVYITIL